MRTARVLALLAAALAPASARWVVVNTWGGPMTAATDAAAHVMHEGRGLATVDALVAGCSRCEALQCDSTVGYGGVPDSFGKNTLDAMVMNGDTMNVGAVAGLQNIKHAIAVARGVMEHTEHSLLVGTDATRFANMLGFSPESLETGWSAQQYADWVAAQCQPNYYTGFPLDDSTCPPYSQPVVNGGPGGLRGEGAKKAPETSLTNHDTIGMVILGANGSMAAGTSSNGAAHKVAGRVGDSPIPGAGSYVDSDVGGAACTGDGDVMLRFSPSYQAVEYMRQGLAPTEACRRALARVAAKYPSFSGAMVCLSRNGSHGGAKHNFDPFAYSLRTEDMRETHVVPVEPI